MNYLDIVLGVLLIIGLVRGISKGIFVELASLVAIVAGIYGAIHFSFYASDFLEAKVNLKPQYIKFTAFAITFIGILLGVSLLGKLLTKIAKFAALGLLNRIAGGIFGLLKIAVIASVVIMFLAPLNDNLGMIKKETLESSILFAPIQKIAPVVYPAIMKKYDEEKDNLPTFKTEELNKSA